MSDRNVVECESISVACEQKQFQSCAMYESVPGVCMSVPVVFSFQWCVSYFHSACDSISVEDVSEHFGSVCER